MAEKVEQRLLEEAVLDAARGWLRARHEFFGQPKTQRFDSDFSARLRRYEEAAGELEVALEALDQ